MMKRSILSLGLCSGFVSAASLPALPAVVAQPPAQQSALPGVSAPPLPAVDPAATAPVQPSVPAASVPPSVAAPARAADPAQDASIFLNFENAELGHFIDYVAQIRKMNLIVDKGVEGSKISLTIRQPLTEAGVWKVFLTVLEMAGFSLIDKGDAKEDPKKHLYVVVPKDKKLQQPLPAFVNVPISALPDNDLTVRYVLFLANIQVKDVKGLLDSMLSNPNLVIAQDDMNAFIITDKALNIKAAVKLLQELDQMGLPEEVAVLKLQRANAADIKQLLTELIKPKDSGNPIAHLLGKSVEGSAEYFSPSTRIVVDERNNALILLGNSKSIQKIIDFVNNSIEKEPVEAKSPLHFYELQHIDAEQLATILADVTRAPDSPSGQTAAKYGSIRGGVKYFKGQPIFKVDKEGNRLIVSTVDRQDWKLLKKIIKDLDKPAPQVAVEMLIVTVDVGDRKKLGGQFRNKKHGQIGRHIDFQSAPPIGASPALESKSGSASPSLSDVTSLLGNILNNFATEKGAAILSFGKSSNLWAVMQAVKEMKNTSIISQPFVTVANKTESTIKVGEDRRIVQEDQGGGFKGYKTENAYTQVTLSPQINLDGIIRMDVTVNIDEFINAQGDKTTKEVKTKATVADGGMLVLGGFVKTKVEEAKQKTWLLGDIPILGWLAKHQNRTVTKQYVFVFLAPTIVKPRQTPGMNLYTRMKLHDATDNIEEAVQTRRIMDPVHNWFFNPDNEQYSHKVIDFANARYQPATVDIARDPYYRALPEGEVEQAIVAAPAMTQSGGQQPIPPVSPLPGPAPITTPIAQPVASLPLPSVAPVTMASAPAETTAPTAVSPLPTVAQLPQLSGIALPQLGVPEQVQAAPPVVVSLPTVQPVVSAPLPVVQVQQQAPEPMQLPARPPARGAGRPKRESRAALRAKPREEELDNQIATQRQRLKQLFNAPVPPAEQADQQTAPPTFKDFLSRIPKNESPTTQERAPIEASQGFDTRNRLKDFFTAQPTSAGGAS